MKCVSYTRAVPCAYDTISIQEQNEIIEEFAKKNKLKISKKYADRKNEKDAEDAFRKIEADGIVRLFDCVVIKSMFAFGPNTYAAYDLLSKTFAPSNIYFAVIDDEFYSWEKSLSEIEIYLRMKYDEYRKYTLRQNMWMLERNKSINKYGYIVNDNGEYIVDPEAAKVVKHIFELALNGFLPTGIAKLLNKEKVPYANERLEQIGAAKVKKGLKEWNNRRVTFILRDKAYTGVVNRFVGTERAAVNIPRLISDDDFTKVQEMFDSRKRSYSADRIDSPLRGILFDKETGVQLTIGKCRDNNGRICMERYSRNMVLHYEKNKISYDTVFDSMKMRLKQEKNEAESALKRIRSEEGKKYLDTVIESMREKARECFEELLVSVDKILPEIQTESAVNEFEILDAEFTEIQHKIKDLEKAFSAENPWIKLYAGIDEENMDNAGIRKRILKAECYRFEKMQFQLAEQNWKELIPDEWRR